MKIMPVIFSVFIFVFSQVCGANTHKGVSVFQEKLERVLVENRLIYPASVRVFDQYGYATDPFGGTILFFGETGSFWVDTRKGCNYRMDVSTESGYILRGALINFCLGIGWFITIDNGLTDGK